MTRTGHVVADISFSAGELTCGCGERVAGVTPEALSDAYQAHRRSAGLASTTVEGWIGKRLGGTGGSSVWSGRFLQNELRT